MATATTNHVDTVNSLLRGELSATETYQQALENVGHEPEAEELRRIHREHREAANEWRKYVHKLGGQPDQDSGAWGMFAKAIEGSAKVFGNTAALKALKEGEEHGVKLYEDALNDHEFPADGLAMIRTTMLPQTREHITVLDRLMQSE
jgi:uncharacterized protein (TIGR02284 family)